MAWHLATAHRAPATPSSWEPPCSGNRDQDPSCVSPWIWTTRLLEVKVSVLLSLQPGADL